MSSDTPPGARKRLVGNAVFGALLVVATLGLAVALVGPQAASPIEEEAHADAYGRAGDTFVRLSYLAGHFSDSYPLRRRILVRAAGYYSLARDSDPWTYGVHLALTLDAMGRRDQAARALSQALLLRMPRARREELRAVLLVLTSDSPKPQWVASAARRLEREVPGSLLLVDAYRRIGRHDLAEAQRREMDKQGLALLPALVTMLAVCGFVLVWGVVGLVWGAGSLVRRGWRRPKVEAPTPPARWSNRIIAEAIIGYLCLQLLVGVVVGLTMWDSPYGTIALLGVGTVVSGAGALVWVRVRPPRGSQLGWDLSRFWRQVAAGLAAAGVVVVPVMLLAGLISSGTGVRPLDDPALRMIAGMPEQTPAWLVAALICAVVPALEESLFRGVVYRGLRSRRSFLSAAVVSAFMFALVHGGAVSLLPVFLLGLVLAYLCERHRSVLAPTVAHAAYNAFNLAILTFMYR